MDVECVRVSVMVNFGQKSNNRLHLMIFVIFFFSGGFGLNHKFTVFFLLSLTPVTSHDFRRSKIMSCKLTQKDQFFFYIEKSFIHFYLDKADCLSL